MPHAHYRYRFEPTAEQRRILARQFGCCRFVYNWALALKEEAYHDEGERINFAETCRRLTQLKQEPEMVWLREVSNTPLQQALRHLDKAYTAFFKRTARLPQFKRRKHRQSATYVGPALMLRDSGTPGQPLVKLAKLGNPLKIRWSRPLPSEPKSATVVLESSGQYYITFVVEVNPKPLPRTKRKVGIELGLHDLVVTSDGWHSGNPRYLKQAQERLALEQRRLSGKQKGSANWDKQRRKVARLHARVANQRRDFLHKLSTRLVRKYDTIYTREMDVKSMMSVRGYARPINDAGWRTLVSMLSYKAEWYGKSHVQIDRWNPSSKTCSACKYKFEQLRYDAMTWSCPKCGARHQRDENAAKNILAVGHTVTACGDEVRPALA